MSRIRTIKPEFWTSEQIVSCSRDARLLFIGIWNFCDDAGIHPASYTRLKCEILPADDCTKDNIKSWVGELIHYELLREYAIKDELFWIVTGWKKHQRIDRPTNKYPQPESELKAIASNSTMNNGALTEYSSNDPRALADTSTIDSRGLHNSSTPDWNGKEGNGKDKDICEVETSPFDLIPQTEQSASNKKNTRKTKPEVAEIFQYWQSVMDHPKAKLDKKRDRIISQALELGYTVEELKRVIDGCAKTPFNMGDNERKQRYDSIDLIFRDADHIDRFINNVSSSLTLKTNYTTFMEGVI